MTLNNVDRELELRYSDNPENRNLNLRRRVSKVSRRNRLL
jgi:hypothetical protein